MGEQLHPALSQLLVAYLIEFDNAVEGWLPHRTSAFGEGGPPSPAPRGGHPFRRPWLVSVTTWQNLLRFLGDGGLPTAAARAASVDLAGVRRWGYVREEDDRVVLTWAGKMAHRIWSELEPAIERRWLERFGAERIAALRAGLEPFAASMTMRTPRGLPQLGFGNGGRASTPAGLEPAPPVSAGELDLGTLLARGVLASTLAYESGAELSAVLGFDLIEPVSEAGGELTRSQLVAASGLSTEAVTAFGGGLVRSGYLAEHRAGRAVAFTMTARGAEAAARHSEHALIADAVFGATLGADAAARLSAVVADIRSDTAALRQTLEPPRGAWRSRPPYAARTAVLLDDPAARLPRQAAVTHRGGFPDGA
ncbi:hypothetical protein ACFOYW_02820 [Gryllotalpicola reticulitermitis]|uniref:Winged helix DNA-binding domain-containing protein n=1 Tax=Gryllotalpicola reticulitermitis TaxID=1184153 RepID=A0ABV8Q1E1_9MICO